jgi:predicted DCC family thiol-disulfide oxidoreductase YuxK
LRVSVVAASMHDERHPPIILFDGICNLCESSVQFVIRHDRRSQFRFASLQSVSGRRILDELESESDELSSIVLVDEGVLFRKSRAALRIVRKLDGAWPALYFLFFWVPPFVADMVYDYIGNRRYQWFGMKEECWIPDESLRARFIDGSKLIR